MAEIKELSRTPLYNFHVSHGARMVGFSGWEMPVQYRGIIEEHLVVRNSVGLFDVSHMGEALVEGKGAKEFLEYLMTNDISKLEQGKALYTLMCYENGGVVDDLLVYCLREDKYLLCLNAGNTQKDIAWLKSHEGRFDCKVEDVSHCYGQLALQGPQAREVLSEWIELLDKIDKFSFIEVDLAGVKVLLSRTGYTGEDGYEIYCPWSETEKLAELIYQTGKVALAGLGARDSLRLEAGYSLYGHEISEDITPLEAGLNFAVKLKKSYDFIGKEALLRQKENGLLKRVLFFKLEDRRIARQGADVYCGDEKVGNVLSGTLSPVLNQPIGSLVTRRQENLDVDIRGNRIPLLLIKPPFV